MLPALHVFPSNGAPSTRRSRSPASPASGPTAERSTTPERSEHRSAGTPELPPAAPLRSTRELGPEIPPSVGRAALGGRERHAAPVLDWYSIRDDAAWRPAALEGLGEGQAPVRVYCDMVGDLFHLGHQVALGNARKRVSEETQRDVFLIVGMCGDEEVAAYKRRPILNVDERADTAALCIHVDEVVKNVPVDVKSSLIDKLRLDFVVRGDDLSPESLRAYYGDAADRGILRLVPYTKSISTTDLRERILARGNEPKKAPLTAPAPPST